jgi:hypothetical protein
MLLEVRAAFSAPAPPGKGTARRPLSAGRETAMRSIALIPVLLALAACNNGTQSADTTTAEAEADGNIVGNSSSSKPSAASEAAADAPAATPAPQETGQ